MMCDVCGCDSESTFHYHSNENLHSIHIEKNILAKNDEFALKNKNYFHENQILALNLMSSPGSGKTTLLVKTIFDLAQDMNFSVIVGDQNTDHDAQRIASTAAPVMQINTGKGCHLDAHQIHHILEKLIISPRAILLIENVGNLVCPALFDLGEMVKVVIMSVTEGDDKPLKYPYMFHAADLIILTKIDLLPYVEFNMQQCIQYIKQINNKAEILQISVTKKQNLNDWKNWIQTKWLEENNSKLMAEYRE